MPNDTIFDYIRNRNRIFDTDGYNPSHQFLKQNTDFEGTHFYNRTKEQFLYLWSHYVVEILNKKWTMWDVEDFAKAMDKAGILCPVELLEEIPKRLEGFLPLRVQALPDGSYCPIGTPFSQIRNTVEGFSDLVTWFEGDLLHAWYPSAVAYETFELYEFMKALKVQYNLDESFMSNIHSFGFRSHSGIEESIIGGSAFNLFFTGSDNLNTYTFTDYVNMTTISAQGHKVVSNFNKEIEAFYRAINSVSDQYYKYGKGKPVVALVIDTFMPYRVIHKYLDLLAPHALSRRINIVLRPDSGKVLHQFKEIIKKVTENNYTNVTVIIGESRNKNAIISDISELISENLPFQKLSHGIGSGLHQHLNRDTHGWGAKTCFSNGENRMKFSEDRFKQSIPGFVNITLVNNELVVELEDYIHDNGLYRDIYFHDDNTKCPIVDIESWKNTYSRIHTSIKYGLNQQKRIIKSPHVIKEMDRIKMLNGMV